MAHVPAQAQNFCSRSVQAYEALVGAASIHVEQWVRDLPFVAGAETVTAEDLVGSMFEGRDPVIVKQFFDAFDMFINSNQALVIGMELFKGR